MCRPEMMSWCSERRGCWLGERRLYQHSKTLRQMELQQPGKIEYQVAGVGSGLDQKPKTLNLEPDT